MAKNDVVRNKLALWCTLSTRKYLLKKSTFREPVIWLLTGLYEFENASMSTLHSTVPSASLGLDAGITAALSGVPVGASFEIGNTTSAKRELQSEGTRVWAAQWQKLDAKYVKRRANAVATPVVQIQLSPDTSYSEGVLLGDHDDESDEEEAVEFVLGGPEELASMNSIEEDEKYEKALDTADAMISRGQR
ncbi:hypothetical protein BDW02DRAFT_573877 [Decorospora gaudefroyi]|uniref:Uncharacterized protein n=1 Tax=Decorospora gaudefroyi TaxID=184978 RepID=A0A6A5JYS6_9PLEO|nr:hypothetical protein BDW02DRAFT_573877 [Decorospora gaudefroyi]